MASPAGCPSSRVLGGPTVRTLGPRCERLWRPRRIHRAGCPIRLTEVRVWPLVATRGSRVAMPKRTESQKSGKQAEAFVAKVVNDMGFIWRGRHEEDFGTDGEIEIVDKDGEVSGSIAFVQVKG